MLGEVVDNEIVDRGEGCDADGVDEIDDGPGELARQVDCVGLSSVTLYRLKRIQCKEYERNLTGGIFGGMISVMSTFGGADGRESPKR